MLFRYLYRRSIRKRWGPLLPLANLSDLLATTDAMTEWQAFRALFFPMGLVREYSPEDMRHVQKIIEDALQRHEKSENPPKI